MIAIRREDKSVWEGRAPIVPQDVRTLTQQGIAVQVQSSPVRKISDDGYIQAGATIVGKPTESNIILGVKEIPISEFEPGKTYLFFSHTIKGQAYNMAMLRHIMKRGCTLIDYERIVDENGPAAVYFGNYAGLAGMIDALWALGKRLEHEGIANPFSDVRRANDYDDLAHAKKEIAIIGGAHPTGWFAGVGASADLRFCRLWKRVQRRTGNTRPAAGGNDQTGKSRQLPNQRSCHLQGDF